MLKIRKRDGRQVPFDETKITEAVFKAARAVGGANKQLAMEITLDVMRYLDATFDKDAFSVEDIQDAVEKILIEKGHAKTAKAYILYRAERTRIREGKSDLMDAVADILLETNRDSAVNFNSPAAKMLQIASAASKSYYLNRLIPEKMAVAHLRGDIYIHKLEYYGKAVASVQIPLKKLLENGFNNGYSYVRTPQQPQSALALAAIALQNSQNDTYGGQGFAYFDRDLAPYLEHAAEEDIYQVMEEFVFHLNNFYSRSGGRLPDSSLNVGLDTSNGGRLATKNLLLAYERGLGRGENPVFPQIIFRLKRGVNLNPGDTNYDLFKLAVRVAAQRLQPTFSFMDATFNAAYDGTVAYLGDRTRVMENRCGPVVAEGRGNVSSTTINLPRLAIRAKQDVMKFYQYLSETMDLVVKQLYHRYTIQAALHVLDMPFLMGQGLYLGSERLDPSDRIEPAIQNGTLAIGFIGLAEALVALTGKHHGESEDSQVLGEEIVAFMRDQADKAGEFYQLNYALLATVSGKLAERFLKLDYHEFGVIPGVTDQPSYTNSYHIPGGMLEMSEKIRREGIYHKYCNAGHMSYVDFDEAPVNHLSVVEDVIRQMARADFGYGGINFPIDFCDQCGYRGVITEDTCPACGSTGVRRICRHTI